MAQGNDFRKLISHCKEYGFVFQSSEIYDGLAAVYDYGQMGVELKNNIKKYIKLGTKNNDTYTIKISDIVLNNSSNDTISITLNEVEKMITIINLIKNYKLLI